MGTGRKPLCLHESLVFTGIPGVQETLVCTGKPGGYRKAWWVKKSLVCTGKPGVHMNACCIQETLVHTRKLNMEDIVVCTLCVYRKPLWIITRVFY
jgi:hypothetical protein